MSKPIYCGSCQWTGDLDGEDYVVLDEVPDLSTRIEPGGEVPAGACAACGCLVFLGNLSAPKEITVHEALDVMKNRLQSDDNDAWNAMDKIFTVFSGAKKNFQCPWCGGSHFESSQNNNRTLTRTCHSCRSTAKFTWHERDDAKYFKWVIRLPVHELMESFPRSKKQKGESEL